MDGAVDLTVVADANLQRIIWKDEEEGEEVEFDPVEQLGGLHWLLAAPMRIQLFYDYLNHDAIPGTMEEYFNDIWRVMSICSTVKVSLAYQPLLSRSRWGTTCWRS